MYTCLKKLVFNVADESVVNGGARKLTEVQVIVTLTA
jgi:hypothetical protein